MTTFTDHTLRAYLEELSSEKPVPGGGSVSAYVAALAMGLTQMVGRVSVKRKKKAGMRPEEEKKDTEKREMIARIVESLEKTKRDAFQIVDLDPKVYEEVMRTWGEEDKMEDALQNSFRLQADLTLLVVMANEWNHHMAHLVTGSIKNDLLVSAGLLEAAFKGAYHTAMINVCYMKNKEAKKRSEKALEELKKRFEKGNESGN
ncbi:MAG: cyclodeaminase/cyclohydrolase family protein [Candidatus Omnitrophica bacterium]|nr:cyclodeaminase/cyclohydrolase family protein [Candidatus Omnitrophota bacterium]